MNTWPPARKLVYDLRIAGMDSLLARDVHYKLPTRANGRSDHSALLASAFWQFLGAFTVAARLFSFP
jgi:hypothetical protein